MMIVMMQLKVFFGLNAVQYKNKSEEQIVTTIMKSIIKLMMMTMKRLTMAMVRSMTRMILTVLVENSIRLVFSSLMSGQTKHLSPGGDDDNHLYDQSYDHHHDRHYHHHHHCCHHHHHHHSAILCNSCTCCT